MVRKGGLPPLCLSGIQRAGVNHPSRPKRLLALNYLPHGSLPLALRSYDLRFTIYNSRVAFFLLTFGYLLTDYLPSSKGAYCANDLCSC